MQQVRDGKTIVTLALQPCAAGEAQLVPGGGIATAILCMEGDELAVVETDPDAQAEKFPSLGALPVARLALWRGPMRAANGMCWPAAPMRTACTKAQSKNGGF